MIHQTIGIGLTGYIRPLTVTLILVRSSILHRTPTRFKRIIVLIGLGDRIFKLLYYMCEFEIEIQLSFVIRSSMLAIRDLLHTPFTPPRAYGGAVAASSVRRLIVFHGLRLT